MSRVWWYKYSDWTPPWWQYLIPYQGEDEVGFRTLVIHVPGAGFLVWAYRRCRNPECIAYRREMGLDAVAGEG